jgi:hypothetical protein
VPPKSLMKRMLARSVSADTRRDVFDPKIFHRFVGGEV